MEIELQTQVQKPGAALLGGRPAPDTPDGSTSASETPGLPAPHLQVRLVIQPAKDRLPYQHTLDINVSDSTATVLGRAKRLLLGSMSWFQRCLYRLGLSKAAVMTGQVEAVTTFDRRASDSTLESQPATRPVRIRSAARDDYLSAALARPSALRDSCFVDDHPELVFGQPIGDAAATAVVLKLVPHKSNIVVMLSMALLVAPALGVAVGLKTKRADVGIAVACGVYALVPAIVALAAWVQS